MTRLGWSDHIEVLLCLALAVAVAVAAAEGLVDLVDLVGLVGTVEWGWRLGRATALRGMCADLSSIGRSCKDVCLLTSGFCFVIRLYTATMSLLRDVNSRVIRCGGCTRYDGCRNCCCCVV